MELHDRYAGERVSQPDATDTVAGNVSPASAALTVTVDTVAPAAPTLTSFSPDSGVVGDGITNATVLTLTGAAAAGSTVEVFDGTTELGTTTTNGSGAWSYTTATLGNGGHSLPPRPWMPQATSALPQPPWP